MKTLRLHETKGTAGEGLCLQVSFEMEKFCHGPYSAKHYGLVLYVEYLKLYVYSLAKCMMELRLKVGISNLE